MTAEKQLALKLKTVLPAIKENGSPITLTTPADTSSGTGYVPGVGFTTPSTPALSYGYGLEIEADYESIDNTLVGRFSKVLLCTEINEPNPDKDTITLDSVVYKIIHVKDLKPGTVSFYYEIYLGT